MTGISKKSARRSRWWIAAAVLIIFGSLFKADFTWWDDGGTVHQNPYFNPTVQPEAFTHYWFNAAYTIYIPLTYAVWAIIAIFARVPVNEFGISLNPAWFHAANILFHLFSAWFVLSILRRLLKNEIAAVLGTMIFALHPVQVESVAWVSGLKDVLSGMFALAAVHQFVVYRQSESKRGLALFFSLALMLLAMLAKPSAMVVPAIILVMDWLIFRTPTRIAIKTFAIYLMAAIPLIAVAKLVQPATSIESPLWARPLIAMDSIAFYLGKIIFPHPLVFDYGRTPMRVIETGQMWWTPIITIAFFGAIAWMIRKKWYLPACGLLIFVVAPAPVLGLVRFEFQDISTVADHYLYVAMFGIALLGGWFVTQSEQRKWVVGIILVALSSKALDQTSAWQDHPTLMKHAFYYVPHGKVPANNLTAWSIRTGNLSDAIRYAEIAYQNRPDEPLTLLNAANVALLVRNDDQAKEFFAQNVALYQKRYGMTDPRVAEPWVKAGDIYLHNGRIEEARKCLQNASLLTSNPWVVQTLRDDIDRMENDPNRIKLR